MEQIEYDVFKTYEAIAGDTDPFYDRVYFHTNENLRSLFSNFSVAGKDVFCVMSSGDHFLSSYYLGASNVDAFDINRLTFYYYYLRKWGFEQKDILYPDGILRGDGEFLRELISHVHPRNMEEERAFQYWKILSFGNAVYNKKIFYSGYSFFDLPFSNDLSRIKEIVSNQETHFQLMDFFSSQSFDKEYDVVILSNILEYCCDDQQLLENCHDNLSRLLKKDGVAVCSSLMDYGSSSLERKVMSSDFSFAAFPKSYNEILNTDIPVGYCYVKK